MVAVRGMVVLLLPKSPRAHSESRYGRERGRSIPFASIRTHTLNGRYRRHSGYCSALARNGSVANDPERHFATVNCRVAKGKGGTSAVLAAAIGACLPCDRSCTQLSDRLDNCSGGAELRAG